MQREFQLKGPSHKLRDFDPRFSKDEGQRALIIKLPTMLLKKDNLDLSPNDSLMGIIGYNLPPQSATLSARLTPQIDDERYLVSDKLIGHNMWGNDLLSGGLCSPREFLVIVVAMVAVVVRAILRKKL